MDIISSATNSKFKTWKSLQSSKGIKENGLCLLSGLKLVEERLKVPGDHTLLVSDGHAESHPQLMKHRSIFFLEKSLFQELDEFGTRSPLLVTPTPEIQELKTETPEGLEIVLPLGDPSNLGAAIRSAAAFGAKILLTPEAAHPFLPKALRASAGLSLSVPLLRCPSLPQIKVGFALDMEGEDLTKFVFPDACRLVIGEEGPGLPAQLKLPRIMIPMAKGAESLNATVAAGVALYAYRSQHPL